MSAIPLVLIVEDDKWLAEQYVRILDKAGYRSKVAFNALTAIRLIDDFCPDAIILDVLLTGNTAFALLHELQSYGDTGNIPVILCTNLAGDLSIGELEPYGVKQIIDKVTMALDDLPIALRKVLS
jgi:DNA-binding response OmpR family regulator